MNQFRMIRQIIRDLPSTDCFGITRCVLLSKKGNMFMNREFWLATKNGIYKGKEYQRIKFIITNWRKRLAIATKHQYYWLNGEQKAKADMYR